MYWIDTVKQFPPLSREEEYALSKNIRENKSDKKESQERLVLSNIRIIIKIASQYYDKYKKNLSSIELNDLIQSGIVGALTATETFDPDRGIRFMTYASWGVKSSIVTLLACNEKFIKLPTDIFIKEKRIHAAIVKYESLHSTIPTLEEISALTGFTQIEIASIQNIPHNELSLDDWAGDDEKSRLENIINGDTEQISESTLSAEEKAKNKQLDLVLQTLSQTEEAVIRLRFGIGGDGKQRTLLEIGDMLGISKQHVSQLITTGLDKLKHPSRKNMLQR